MAFSRVLSDAIARQSLTLEQIVQRVAASGRTISPATLSYWQRGRSLPSRESSLGVIDELERILRLPIGHLRGSLPSDAFSRWDRVQALPKAERARGLLEDMGLDPLANFDTIYVHDHVDVAADRRTRVEETVEFLTALHDDVTATALVLGLSGEENVPHIEATQGCELGRVVMLPDLGLMAVELLLLQKVRAGEPFVRGTRVTWRSDDAVQGDLARVLGRSLPMVVLEVDFAQPPARVWYATTPNQWETADASDRMRQPLPVGGHVQVCLTDPPAGWHGLSWEYDDE